MDDAVDPNLNTSSESSMESPNDNKQSDDTDTLEQE